MSTSSSDPRGFGPRFFAVVPAGGVGTRLGAPVPKQYLEAAGRSLLGWSVSALLAADWIDTVVVVVAPGDQRAAVACADLLAAHSRRLQILPLGGATRRDSVLGGVEWLAEAQPALAVPEDWVLVHDAARPGLGVAALQRLREASVAHPVGGLLALPVADTVKRGDARGEVVGTLEREGLWLAQTPQMFRVGPLRAALRKHPQVTDEASAMEAQGQAVLLVEGDRRNFKVTTVDDLAMMAALLAQVAATTDGAAG